MPAWLLPALWGALGVLALITWSILIVRIAKPARRLFKIVEPTISAATYLQESLEEERILVARLKRPKADKD